MRGWNHSGALLGRILLSLIFLGAGTSKFADMLATENFMAAMGMPPAIVPLLAYLAAIIEVVGGLMVLVGFKARAAALVLFFFLIPVTIIFHAIPHDLVNTLKNIAIMGGLLMVVTMGPGGLSVDQRRHL